MCPVIGFQEGKCRFSIIIVDEEIGRFARGHKAAKRRAESTAGGEIKCSSREGEHPR